MTTSATFEAAAGTTATDSGAGLLAPGSWLGRYQIVRLIGRGGMGCVYEAIHRDLGKRVAIKTLASRASAGAEARLRFLREGQAASRIRHPHVVDITDVVADGPVTYLVMEYFEGEELSAFIARRGPMSVCETADIVLPVLAAIVEAHGRGVIHRDLKPENLFLARAVHGGVSPKVIDFGISKLVGADVAPASLTGTSAILGTTYYLAPEQLRGTREADARSDQYALGAILYECVTGRRAFDGDNVYAILKSVAEGDYPPARTLRPDLPARLDAAITRAMSVDPAARFASVAALGAVVLEHARETTRALWAPIFAPGAGSGVAPRTRTLLLDTADGRIRTLASELVPRRSPAAPLAVCGVALAVVFVVVATRLGSPPSLPRSPTLLRSPSPLPRSPPSPSSSSPSPSPSSPRSSHAPAPSSPTTQAESATVHPASPRPQPRPVRPRRRVVRRLHKAAIFEPRTNVPIVD